LNSSLENSLKPVFQTSPSNDRVFVAFVSPICACFLIVTFSSKILRNQSWKVCLKPQDQMNEKKLSTKKGTPVVSDPQDVTSVVTSTVTQETGTEAKTDSKKKSPPMKFRSTRINHGLSESDAEAKSRARSSFYSSSSIRFEITKLEAEKKVHPRAGPSALASSRGLSTSWGPRQREASTTPTNNINYDTEKEIESPPIRDNFSGLQQEEIPPKKPGKPFRSGMTGSRNLDELIAYKTGIPLDQSDEDEASSEELGSNDVAAESVARLHYKLRQPGSMSLRKNRQYTSSASFFRSGMTSAGNLEELIAYKTGIPLNDLENNETGSERSPSPVDGITQTRNELTKPEPMHLHSSSVPRSTILLSQPGITDNRDLDQLIAYKTGIPLDPDPEENMETPAVVGVQTNPPKPASFPSESNKSNAKIELNGNDPRLQRKMGNTPRPTSTSGNPSLLDIECKIEGDDLITAEEIEEQTENAFIPSAVEYDPEAKPPLYKNRRFRLYGALTLGLLVVVIVGTIGILVKNQEESSDNRQSTIPPESEDESLSIRAQLELIVGKEQLSDKSSAHYRAMKCK
jgi:hypothetical protein